MKHVISTASRYALEFLHWWVLELSEALEDLRSHLAPRWRRSLTVFVSRSRLQMVDGDSRDTSAILEVALTEAGPEPTFPLSEAQKATLAGGRRVRLVFDSELAFVQQLRMPVAAVPHLASAIELQIPKLLPIEAVLLRSDFEIVAVDPEDGCVDIELAAIKRSDIEPIENTIRQWGLQLGSVHLGCPSDSRFRFKFGMSDTRVNRFAMTRADTFLAASAASLVLCAIAVFSVQAVRARKSLDRALVEAGTRAAAVLQQRQQLVSRLETLSVVAQSERVPTAAAILADVTTRLDRDVWLTTFELKGRDLRLLGLSSEPATIVKELAASAVISEVELHSSMSTSTHGGKDRFEITARVKAGT